MVIVLVVAGLADAQFVKLQTSMWKAMTAHVCGTKNWSREQSWPEPIRSGLPLNLELLALVPRHLYQIRVCCLEVEVSRRWVSQHGYCANLLGNWLPLVSKGVMRRGVECKARSGR